MSSTIKYNADKYTWQVVYNDGTSLWECSQGSPVCALDSSRQYSNSGIDEHKAQSTPKAYGSQGSPTPRSGSNGSNDVGDDQGHPIIAKYDQIDRDKITKFNVYETEKLGTDDLKPVISLDIKSGYRLIWRKRRHQRVIGPQVPFKTVYLVGWQATIGGQNIQSIIYLYEDGKMEMSSQKSDYELFNFETETP